MTDLSNLPAKKLKKLMAETEDTLTALKQELERREEADQVREVERLDEHFQNAELSLKAIKDFLRYLADELRVKA